MFTKTRPLISARSTRRSPPFTSASSAPTTSSRSTPRSSAKWFLVPAGMQANGRSCWAAMLATSAWVPSPPAAARASAPRATASLTSCHDVVAPLELDGLDAACGGLGSEVVAERLAAAGLGVPDHHRMAWRVDRLHLCDRSERATPCSRRDGDEHDGDGELQQETVGHQQHDRPYGQHDSHDDEQRHARRSCVGAPRPQRRRRRGSPAPRRDRSGSSARLRTRGPPPAPPWRASATVAATRRPGRIGVLLKRAAWPSARRTPGPR